MTNHNLFWQRVKEAKDRSSVLCRLISEDGAGHWSTFLILPVEGYLEAGFSLLRLSEVVALEICVEVVVEGALGAIRRSRADEVIEALRSAKIDFTPIRVVWTSYAGTSIELDAVRIVPPVLSGDPAGKLAT